MDENSFTSIVVETDTTRNEACETATYSTVLAQGLMAKRNSCFWQACTKIDSQKIAEGERGW